METSEPVSYDFPGHAVSAFAHRRSIDSTLSHNFPFYSHQTASYSLHYQTSSSLPYSFGHSSAPVTAATTAHNSTTVAVSSRDSSGEERHQPYNQVYSRPCSTGAYLDWKPQFTSRGKKRDEANHH
ncbi:hypothetical protein DTO012A8_7957 [Penicillium roqueforti]|nr:hypothetical protein DTO012A8_7957 [Penicillium roqueforti]